MLRYVVFAMALAIPSTTWSQESAAHKLAQEILDKGSALFDTRDAAAMAATYTEDAKLVWVSKNEQGTVSVDVKNGRAEIEDVYHGLFKDRNDKTTSKNTVEFARLVAHDVLLIQGDFQPDVAGTGKYPFIQVRIKNGDKWLMKTLQLFVISQD